MCYTDICSHVSALLFRQINQISLPDGDKLISVRQYILTHYQNRVLCRASITLRKGFVECCTRQEILVSWLSATVSLPSTLYRILSKVFAKRHLALGKKVIIMVPNDSDRTFIDYSSHRHSTQGTHVGSMLFFMPSVQGDTRRRNSLYRVSG